MWDRVLCILQQRVDTYENDRRLLCFLQRAERLPCRYLKVLDVGNEFVIVYYRRRIAEVLSYDEIVYDIAAALDKIISIEQVEREKERRPQ